MKNRYTAPPILCLTFGVSTLSQKIEKSVIITNRKTRRLK